MRPVRSEWVKVLKGQFIEFGVSPTAQTLVICIPPVPGVQIDSLSKEETEKLVTEAASRVIADGNHR